jgi:proton translocating ATP synthase F1 alpha subunit
MFSHRISDSINVSISLFSTSRRNLHLGFVTRVTDEIVYCLGLPKISFGEVICCKINNHVYNGLVIDISRHTTSCMFFTNTKLIQPGQKVYNRNHPMYVQVSAKSLGSLVDCLGLIILSQSRVSLGLDNSRSYKVERPAPGITLRTRIYQPLHTGNILIDSLFPIGRGQRELILGDRQTGKTTVAINSIRSQKSDNLLSIFKKNLYCIYVAVGQKKSNIIKLYYFLKKEECLHYTIIMSVSSSDPASLQFLAPYSGCSMAEYFRDRGQDTLVIYDDLSKQAVAYRQISLLLRRPPGREAYPGDIFYLHARLLERAAKMTSTFKGGSLTALPIVETLVGDISSYIPTNVISITDGQIFLDNQIFNKYYKPAVNIELSVSRVGSKAQVKFYRKISKRFQNILLKFMSYTQSVDLSTEENSSRTLLKNTGERLLLVINHRNFVCIELQFFFMVLILSGLLNAFSIEQSSRIIKNLSFYYSKNLNLGLNFFKGIPEKVLISKFSTPGDFQTGK